MKLSVTLHHRIEEFNLDVEFSAPSGITALFGRSGAGKTTVVNAVAGLLSPSSGRVTIDGDVLLDTSMHMALPPHKRRVGYVFQEGRLFPHLTVRQNLGFGSFFARRRKEQPKTHLDSDGVVDLLGISHLLDRRPGGLSGGEKQRVSIGRALLSQPRLLLMDEPLASLDEPRKAEILPFLERLRDETHIPILYVSHSLEEVARLATTVVALSDGKVARAGPVEEILADPEAFPLLGRHEAGGILQAKVVGFDERDGLSELSAGGGRLFLPGAPASIGTELRVRIRARDVILSVEKPSGLSTLNTLEAVVTKIGTGDGPIVEVGLLCGGDQLLARITKRSLRNLKLKAGSPCFAILKAVAVNKRDIGRG